MIAVGKRNPRRIAYPAPTVDIFRTQRLHILILQYAQNLPQSDCAGTWRTHATNFIFTIRRTNRLTLDNLIVFQIRHTDFAGIIHSTGNGTDNILRLHSLIKRRTAFFRQQAYGTRKFRVFQHRSRCQRLTVRQEIGGGLRITLQGFQILLDGFRHTRRNGKTLFRQSNRFLKQTCPRQFAVTLMDIFQQLRNPRHTDRTAADHCFHKAHRFAVFVQEKFWRCRFRRCFTGIKRCQLFRLIVPIHQKRTAAQSGRLRLGQAQGRLHGDHRIYRAAAAFQYFVTRFGRQRIGRRRHIMFGAD
ncbi:Uncharacterised protein [Mycobacteroides abscessus subsp. massiliense]|nr:Uncharacterised protein [Mycobacteroides abscessus subsp. massiliense]